MLEIVIQHAVIRGILQEFGKNGQEAADDFGRYTLSAVQRRLGAVWRGILSRIQGTETSNTAGLEGANTAVAGLLDAAQMPLPVSETCRPSQRRRTAARRDAGAFCLVFRRGTQG